MVKRDISRKFFYALPLVAVVFGGSNTNCWADTPGSPSRIYRGEVSTYVSPALDNEIKELVNGATANYVTKSGIDHQAQRFDKAGSVLLAKSKDAIELATSFKGFEQSSEAADVILDEKLKVKSKASVAYVKQSSVDKLHVKLVAALMQIAMGNGFKKLDERADAINQGTAQLSEIVGKERAAHTVQLLGEWCSLRNNLEFGKYQPVGGPLQVNHEVENILGQSIQHDAVVNEIKGRLHRYNGHSNFARGSVKVINTGLSIASMSPTIIAPAAQGAWVAFIMTQGGSEEGKLVKEVYLEKRFESRWTMLKEEAALLVSSYDSAVYTKNPALLAFTQYLMTRMCEPADGIAATSRAKAEEDVVWLDSAGSPPPVQERI